MIKIIIIAFVLMVAYAARIRFRRIPLDRDYGALCNYASTWLKKGELPGVVGNLSMPGLWMIYAFILKFIGRTERHFHQFFAFYHLLATAFFYLLAGHFFSFSTATVATLFYILFSSLPRLWTYWSNSEKYIDMPTLASLYLIVLAGHQGNYTFFIAAGILSGIAVMFKQTALLSCVSPITFSMMCLRFPILLILSFFAGISIVIFIYSFYYICKGKLNDIFFSPKTLLNAYRLILKGEDQHRDALGDAYKSLIRRRILDMLSNFNPLLILSFSTICYGIFAGRVSEGIVIFSVWAAFSALTVILGREYLCFHFISCIAPSSFLAAYSATVITSNFLQGITKGDIGIVSIFSILGIIVSFGIVVFQNYKFYFVYTIDDMCKLDPDMNLSKIGKEIGLFLRDKVSRNDSIYVWGSEEEIYHFAECEKACPEIRLVYPNLFYTKRDDSRIGRFRLETVMTKLKETLPKYIVIMWPVLDYTEFINFVNENYKLECVFQNQFPILRLKDELKEKVENPDEIGAELAKEKESESAAHLYNEHLKEAGCKISVCLIVQNCERSIETCLKSIQNFADEIIIVDGGSTDRTAEISRKYATKYLFNEWSGNHSAQRNVYLQHATGDWIFVIDSDEFVGRDFGEKIKKLVQSNEYVRKAHQRQRLMVKHQRLRLMVSYWFPRCWITSVNPPQYIVDSRIYPDLQHRLFKRQDGISYSGVIHETLNGLTGKSAEVSDMKIYHLDLVLKSRAEREQKVQRYEESARGSGFPQYYLFEDYGYRTQQITERDLTEESLQLLHSLTIKGKSSSRQKYSLYHVEGCEASIKAWQAPYVDFFKGCQKVLDVGCGPGLFLELLHERDIPAFGIDYDPEMVNICKEKRLNAQTADAATVFQYSGEFDGIHAGHIIEHLNGEQAIQFLEGCFTALKPGGLLVVRTPNWENETVRNGGFWLDHTHARPYPLQLLERIFLDIGLEIVQKGTEPTGWNDIFIVGRKPGYGATMQPSAAKVPKVYSDSASEQITIIWEGSQFVNHSLASVNRELCIALAQSDKCELSLIPYEQHQFGVEADPERFGLIDERLNKPLSRSADFHIRHQWPPKFEPPKEGYWILMQPWEYGSMPKEWLPHLRDLIDEVWVYSDYNRDCYIQDGLDPDKVAVVPLSVDHTRFHPDVLPLPLIAERTDKSFKFLFVGGTIWRKGIDVLLEAYSKAFTRDDDVCLIIKDIGQDSFYAGQTAAEKIKELLSNPKAPEIIHLTEMLPQEDMPRLYTACDCLVHPYRGEGFCLPVAEAMACGLPVIVTKGGACDDFCTDDTVCWISASRVEIKIQEETVNQAWALEPDLEALVAQMRYVVANPDETKRRGKQASEHIRQTLSWEKSAELILERLAALKAKQILRKTSIPINAVVQPLSPQSQQPSGDMVATQDQPLDETEIRARQYLQIANQYKGIGELERALVNYKRALDVKPDYFDALMLYGITLAELERTEKAIEILKKAVSLNPNYPALYNELGKCFYKIGQVEDAKNAFQKALELNSWDSQAYSNLGVLFWEAGNIDAAIKNLKQAIEINPDDADAVANLAIICYQVGLFQEAIPLFKKFLIRQPQDAQMHFYLSDCYFKTGEKLMAKKEMEILLAIEPEHQLAQELYAKLEVSFKSPPCLAS